MKTGFVIILLFLLSIVSSVAETSCLAPQSVPDGAPGAVFLEIPVLLTEKTWQPHQNALPEIVKSACEELLGKKKEFRLLKGRNSFLLIQVEGFNGVGFFVKSEERWLRIVEKGSDILFPFVNRILLDPQGNLVWRDARGIEHRIPLLNDELRKHPVWMTRWITENITSVPGQLSVRHGLVRKLPFEIGDAEQQEGGAIAITGVFDFEAAMDRDGIQVINPVFYEFFKSLKLEVTYTLIKNRWEMAAKAIHKGGDHDIPVALTIHYWLNTLLIPGMKRAEVHLSTSRPLTLWPSNPDRFPISRPVDVTGDLKRKYDLWGKGITLGLEEYDDVFHFGKGGATTWVSYPSLGRVAVTQGDNMENLVICVTSPTEPSTAHLLAMEPSTSPTDAFTMQEEAPEETHLPILNSAGTVDDFASSLEYLSYSDTSFSDTAFGYSAKAASV